MIVDNVDDLNVIFSRSTEDGPLKNKSQLLSCIPQVSHGSVLFTTRWRHVANNITKRDHICLAEMDKEQGVCLSSLASERLTKTHQTPQRCWKSWGTFHWQSHMQQLS
jgi:hypothetical protein